MDSFHSSICKIFRFHNVGLRQLIQFRAQGDVSWDMSPSSSSAVRGVASGGYSSFISRGLSGCQEGMEAGTGIEDVKADEKSLS